jgi:sulfonate transport system substrate-binding protein
MKLRLGLHPNNLSLRILSRTPILERHLAGSEVESVEFVRFQVGPRTVDYIAAGTIDLGGTGATPPITGQADGIPLVYVATSAGRPVGGIVVAQTSPIRDLADLRGKRVGLAVGSWLQQLLIFGLALADVGWRDIVPVDIRSDAAADTALRNGEIDAWATGAVIDDPSIRFLARTEELISNPSVFFAARRFADEHRDVLERVVAALDEADEWTAAHPAEAAELLAADVEFGGDRVAWEPFIRARPWGLQTVSDGFLAEQQRTADLFLKNGLLARQIDVRDARLNPPLQIGIGVV